MKITDVNIIPIKPKDGLIGFANIIADGNLWLSSIAIYTRLDGSYRLLYPTKLAGGKAINVFHPINRVTSNEIERAVFEKCKEVFERSDNDRHYQIQHRTNDASET